MSDVPCRLLEFDWNDQLRVIKVWVYEDYIWNVQILHLGKILYEKMAIKNGSSDGEIKVAVMNKIKTALPSEWNPTN